MTFDNSSEYTSIFETIFESAKYVYRMGYRPSFSTDEAILEGNKKVDDNESSLVLSKVHNSDEIPSFTTFAQLDATLYELFMNSNNMKAIVPYLVTNLTVLISNGWNHTRDLGQLSLNLLCEMNGLSKLLKMIDGNASSTNAFSLSGSNVPTPQKTPNPAATATVSK